MKRITHIEKSFMKENIPPFSSGDTLRVHVKIKEGDKERVQVFQGTVISRRGGGTGETFTVRKISSGVGVERVFPLHSPNVAKIEKIRSGAVRRSKLYYLRDLTGKSARIKEELSDKSMNQVNEEAAPVVEETPAPEVQAEEAKVEETVEVKAEEAASEEAPAEEAKTEAEDDSEKK